jgi:hypothetical protein
MSRRFAESSRNAVSDIVELALYSISVLLIFLLWYTSSLAFQRYPCASANDAHQVCGRRKSPWPA